MTSHTLFTCQIAKFTKRETKVDEKRTKMMERIKNFKKGI